MPDLKLNIPTAIDVKNLSKSTLELAAEEYQKTKNKVASLSATVSPYIKNGLQLGKELINDWLFGYPKTYPGTDKKVNLEVPRGSEDYEADVKAGDKRLSLVNKIHIIKLNGIPADDKEITSASYVDTYTPKTCVDLCQNPKGMVIYDIEDFLYCKWLGVPINRMITLRRFPTPCIDNIFTINRKNRRINENEQTNDVGDIARMVAYMTAETNKIDDILSLSYAMKWKQLTAEFDQMSSFGEQSGVSGYIKNVAKIFDNTTNSNYLSGRSTGGPMSSYDPKFDQNRVYGPVDSINETHIRDVGLEFNKEFEITFDYDLRSINGRTPEYAMKDILGNILACTFNSGKFWAGSRYWVGERPSPWAKKLQWMNSGNIDTVMKGMIGTLTNVLKSCFGSKQSALQTLKNAVRGGFAIAMGKLLDGLGRPGIPAMNSLLSSAPVGEWHLMVGNPHNPILSIGNLICTGTDIKFPTDALSYGDFPTKMQVIVKLKPGMPKDKPQIESMFNHGQGRMYWQPTKQSIIKKNSNSNIPATDRTAKLVNSEQTNLDISRQLQAAYDFIPYTDTNVTEDDIDKGRAKIKNPDITINGENGTVQNELYDTYVAKDADGKEIKEQVEKNADNVQNGNTANNDNTANNGNTANNNSNNTTNNIPKVPEIPSIEIKI